MTMFLKNAYATHLYKSLGASVIGDYGEMGNTVLKTMIGTTGNAGSQNLFANLEMPTKGYLKYYLWLGTGTDEPQFYDYDIPNAIVMSETEGFTISSVSNKDIIFDVTTNTFRKESSVLFRNNTAEDVTVTELYLMSANTNFDYKNNVLFYKELLDEPIVVVAGKYLEVTFERILTDDVMSVNINV